MPKTPSKARPPQKRDAHGHFASRDPSSLRLPHVGLHAHPDIHDRLSAIEDSRHADDLNRRAHAKVTEANIRAVVEERLAEHAAEVAENTGHRAKLPMPSNRKENHAVAWTVCILILAAAAIFGAYGLGWFGNA